MENIKEKKETQQLRTEFYKLFNLDDIKEDFHNSIKNREKEHNLLLENNLIDPSIVLSLQYSTIKLDLLLFRPRYRIYFLGTSTAKTYEFINCFLGDSILPKLNNIIIIIRHSDDCIELWSSQIKINNQIDFVERDFICKGEIKNVRESLALIDKDKVLNSLVPIEDLSSFVYILKLPLPFSPKTRDIVELVVCPPLAFNNNIKMSNIKNVFEKDFKQRSEFYEAERRRMENEIIAKTKIEMMEDLYFKHHILGRGLKQDIVINIITPDNIIHNQHKDIIEISKPLSNSILKSYLIIDDCDTLSPSFVVRLNDNLKLNFSSEKSKEKESLDLYINFANDDKILPERRLEFTKKYIKKLITSSSREQKLEVCFLSSGQTILNRINEKTEETRENHFKYLYIDNAENIIYDTFEEFKESKLSYLIRKSGQYNNHFSEFETKLDEFLKNNYYGEVNHFYTACLRYSMIMNDLLNIQANQFKDFNIEDEIGLDSVIIVYSKIIAAEFEDFSFLLTNFEEDFLQAFESFTQTRIKEIDEWYDSVYFPTSTKIDDLISYFQELFDEMKARVEHFAHEVIERDVKLLISIRNQLKETGYLNDFISKYLTNVQSSLVSGLNNYDQVFTRSADELINDVYLSGGIGLAGSLFGFGIGRIITAITADAITGSVAGPVGTITGATVGALSIVGTSVYHYNKYKSDLKEKYLEMMSLCNDYRKALVEKISSFIGENKDEINKRLLNMMSYIEYSLRKSFKF